MLFDTDILIWIQRGNTRAATLLESEAERYISVQTYMELLQCAQNKQQQQVSKRFLTDFNIMVLPFSANIGQRQRCILRNTVWQLGCALATLW